jgi:hypothetical protein
VRFCNKNLRKDAGGAIMSFSQGSQQKSSQTAWGLALLKNRLCSFAAAIVQLNWPRKKIRCSNFLQLIGSCQPRAPESPPA